MREHEDAYGRLLLSYLEHQQGGEIVERDDGFIEAMGDAGSYFSEYQEWPAAERKALRLARGRILDVGCGAGRVALHLQERGHDVVGIDISPLAVEVCRRRGVKDARELPLTRVDPSLGRFDTIVMFGNNFGLFGNRRRARWLLRRLRGLTNEGARILGETRDPYDTDVPHHLAYHERNRQRGRMAGQLRIRVRFLTYATPWFEYLIVSPAEMDELVAGTGWRVARRVRDGVMYVGVLERVS